MTAPDLYWSDRMNIAQKLTRYKAWANQRSISHVMALPDGEAEKPRDTYFGSIMHTLHHNYIVDDIFRAHLQARAHGYTSRGDQNLPFRSDLWDAVVTMDAWWIEFVDGMTPDTLGENISFEFIGGDSGTMTRLEIIMHVVNHTSYHRGFVDEMLGQMKMDGPACDFPVYLREMARPA